MSTKQYLYTKPTSHHLAEFIREHGHPCRVQEDGTIRAAVRYTSTQRTARGGGGGWMVETVQPNLQAVRDWLGY